MNLLVIFLLFFAYIDACHQWKKPTFYSYLTKWEQNRAEY